MSSIAASRLPARRAVQAGRTVQPVHLGQPGQAGQAVAEGLIVLLGLAVAVLAIAHTGRWHGAALHTSLSARQAAFAWTRGERSAGEQAFAPDAFLQLQGMSLLADTAQPGGVQAQAGALRRQWGMHDVEIHAVQAVTPGLRLPFGTRRLSLRRHTAVLAGAGHAADDAAVQRRMAQSALAWADAARASQQAGRQVAGRMAPVDRAWGRPQPDFDWLQAWAGAVPPEHTRGGSRSGRGR